MEKDVQLNLNDLGAVAGGNYEGRAYEITFK